MRVVVTGVSGFAGGCVARRLAAMGYDVIAVARSPAVEPPDETAARARFHAVQATGDYVGALPAAVDAVVHAAATSIWSGISVDRMITDNVRLTQDIVRYAVNAGASRFIFFSSVSAFGAITTDPLNEANPVLNPDAYGVTKVLGEQFLADIADHLPSLSIRLPSIIGRGAKRNWPSECLRKLRANVPLTYFNPSAPYNNLIHEGDVAALVAAALTAPLAGADMVVVGSDGEIKVAQVVTLLRDGTGSTSPIDVVATTRRNFRIDWSKAAARYGFAPMRVDDALRRFLADSLGK